MTTPAVTLNPTVVTNASGTFSATLDGYIQGFAEDDPAVRYQLTGGQLAAAETVPDVGGVPVLESIAASTTDPSLQTSISRATNATTTTGWSVFNQNYQAINTPQSPVPGIGNGMLVNLFRNGSNARIAVAMDPAMTSLPTTAITPTALYWDVTNYRITLTTSGGNWALPTTIKLIRYNIGNSMVSLYTSATGFLTWVRTGSCALIQI